MRPAVLVPTLCAAELLTMLGVYAFPALMPDFISLWSLSNTQAGWIAGFYYAGYIVLVPILVAITDRMDAKRVYVAGAVVSALGFAGFAFLADGFVSAMIFQVLAGIGLAGTYMPGLKALVDRGGQRFVAFYTASFSGGTALSFLFAGEVAAWLGWQGVFWLAGASALLAAMLVGAVLKRHPPQATDGAKALLEAKSVVRNRPAFGYILAYTGHIWELFGFRAWIVAFLTFSLSLQAAGADGGSFLKPTTVAMLASVVAALSSITGEEIALKFGRRRLVFAAMLLSGTIALLIGLSAPLPYWLVVVLVFIYSGSIQGESAAATAGAVAFAPPQRRGITLAVHSILGFAAGIGGTFLFGVILDHAGGREDLTAWWLAFASLGVGVLLGSLGTLMVPRGRPGQNGPSSKSAVRTGGN